MVIFHQGGFRTKCPMLLTIVLTFFNGTGVIIDEFSWFIVTSLPGPNAQRRLPTSDLLIRREMPKKKKRSLSTLSIMPSWLTSSSSQITVRTPSFWPGYNRVCTLSGTHPSNTFSIITIQTHSTPFLNSSHITHHKQNITAYLWHPFSCTRLKMLIIFSWATSLNWLLFKPTRK